MKTLFNLFIMVGILYSSVMLIIAIADNNSDCFMKGFVSIIITGVILLYNTKKS